MRAQPTRWQNSGSRLRQGRGAIVAESGVGECTAAVRRATGCTSNVHRRAGHFLSTLPPLR
jgi:hypothetical protein